MQKKLKDSLRFKDRLRKMVYHYKQIKEIQSPRKNEKGFKKMKDYDFTNTINQFKNTDSGRFGKAFEINVKRYLNGNRGNSGKVSAKGKNDVKSKGLIYEIKSNCGELERIEKNDFIIYSMDNIRDYDKPYNAKVINPIDFITMLNNLGLVRTKKSTSGTIKTTIQSYKNSKKKTALLSEALEQYPTLKEWVASK